MRAPQDIRRRRAFAVALVLISAAIGCGGPTYQIAEVDGVLLIGEKPARKVQIQFVPDVGNNGPTSMAKTNEDGKFTLQLMERDRETARAGAVVGSHRVVLSDMQLSESESGRGVPIRFGNEYMLVGSTPLTQVVKEGKQTIEIKLP